jgi:hypothetical protein
MFGDKSPFYVVSSIKEVNGALDKWRERERERGVHQVGREPQQVDAEQLERLMGFPRLRAAQAELHEVQDKLAVAERLLDVLIEEQSRVIPGFPPEALELQTKLAVIERELAAARADKEARAAAGKQTDVNQGAKRILAFVK